MSHGADCPQNTYRARNTAPPLTNNPELFAAAS